ncbi:hypothetical protein U9M48_041486 [Paspalum notatum var. saurae]|uniref:Cupin type-1 domain-containing protein n=1 Tax=Paspalum notatum var. saurae TaxID=547442 RepID=A0AAQ3UT93_PASNO
MATSSGGQLPLSCACLLLLLLLLCSGSAAAAASSWGSPRRGAARACGFDGRLEAMEPRQKVQSEAGYIEYFHWFTDADGELTCAGLFPIRVVVDPQGLLTARYTNAHGLAYVVQGTGVVGFSFPGCPSSAADEQQYRNVHRFQQGDVVAMPAGVRWLYNDGDAPLVLVYVFDTNNDVNQLEPSMRKFLLAGGYGKGTLHFAENIFRGIDAHLLSEAMDVSVEVAERLQSRRDHRGEIVRVDHGLHLHGLPPPSSSFPHHDHHQSYYAGAGGWDFDGSSSSLCGMEVRRSVEVPGQAGDDEYYNPGAGQVTRLTRRRFPILDVVQMSAARVDVYPDAVLAPSWNLNGHSALYALSGRARVQVASDNGTAVFDGALRAGQLLVVPQGYLVAGKAQGAEGFQYVSFETNPEPVVSHFAGRRSVLNDLPVDVVAGSYGVSREEAMALKNNRRHEHGVFAPRTYYHQGRAGCRAQE